MQIYQSNIHKSMQKQVTFFLNGEKTIMQAKTLHDLLQELSIDVNKIAIEKDLTIIHRNELDKTFIENNCKIEIVHFIGGG